MFVWYVEMSEEEFGAYFNIFSEVSEYESKYLNYIKIIISQEIDDVIFFEYFEKSPETIGPVSHFNSLLITF